MASLFGKNAHDKSQSFGQETMIPTTVIECPPMKVIGARVYAKTPYGLKALGEATIEKIDRNLRRKIRAFKKKGKKRSREGKGSETGKSAEGKEKHGETGKTYLKPEDLDGFREKAAKVSLIVEAQPSLTGIGKKKADVAEVSISGSIEQQFAFAKEKFGKEIRVSEVFAQNQFVDVKAVDKGKGFQGVVKRAGVKVHRPKAKKHRYVGSIGPWHPPTVMWTVPRPGQMGYQTRTEYNKKILLIDSNAGAVNPKAGFLNYGNVKNEFVVLSGSVPGPAKRIVAMRHAVRLHNESLAKYSDLKLPSAFSEKGEPA